MRTTIASLVLMLVCGASAAERPRPKPMLSRGPDAAEVLAEGFIVFDPDGWCISGFDGPQDAQDLLRAGFFIYDVQGRLVERFSLGRGGWSHRTAKTYRLPPKPRGRDGYVPDRIWPTVRDVP